ncbi:MULTISPECIES: mycofactocin system transcriptional regulator [Streptacidiphilus]|uniref:Mycofactocin system transcriptional regulator n=1 Tax=Streptacidiphilus cavernicola TaxID=3342716 RepID=A0ABV6UUT4_9ACTN|nr:mycofactocin system transcriptional regulator [Streptacidiphilus jeojiense]
MERPEAGLLDPGRSRTRTGRPRATSRGELERIGFELFESRGFDAVTVDDIAAAAGIGRRTFFRYYATKNDLVWGDFEGQLAWLRQLLAAVPADVPTMAALRSAVVEFNRFDPQTVPWHRRRMDLIFHVPALQADSTLRYNAWRGIVTEFAAARSGQQPTDTGPTLIGHVALAASAAAYELWLRDEEADLAELLDATFGRLATGL